MNVVCTNPISIPVVMAKGSHLFPYRTQKLSLSAPMVLGWRRPGRVGHCRIPYEKSFRRSLGLFSYPIDINLLSGYLGQRATLYLARLPSDGVQWTQYSPRATPGSASCKAAHQPNITPDWVSFLFVPSSNLLSSCRLRLSATLYLARFAHGGAQWAQIAMGERPGENSTEFHSTNVGCFLFVSVRNLLSWVISTKYSIVLG